MSVSFLRALYRYGIPQGMALRVGMARRLKPFVDFDDIGKYLKKTYINQYFGVGLGSINITTRPKVNEVKFIPCAWLDVDVGVEGHGDKRYPPTKKEAHDIIDIFPEPSATVWSGHGYHFYWFFDHYHIITTPKSFDRIRSFLYYFQEAAIQQARKLGYTIDNTSDLARIMRVPGTQNEKPACEIVECVLTRIDPDKRYSLMDLELKVGDVKIPPPPPKPNRVNGEI